MGEPWDAPPFPKRGNRDQRVLYEAIGRALVAWEELETELAHLFAAFCGESRFDEEANNTYGEQLNFAQRMNDLQRAAKAYFVRYPNQVLEAEFCWVSRFTIGFSRRRNDVAHGVVRLIGMVQDQHETLLGAPLQWCLIPPHFREAKFISRDIPAHILTSREINKFAVAFVKIMTRAHFLSSDVELPQHAWRRKFGAPPTGRR